MTPINPYQLAARLRKATALADILLGAGITSGSELSEESWLIAEALRLKFDSKDRRVKPPSPETRAMVVENLRKIEGALAKRRVG